MATTNNTNSRPILNAIIGIIGVCIVLALGVYIALNAGTRHGEEIIVPDFSAMSVEKASMAAAEKGLLVDVTDSVYIKRMDRGLVYRQNPTAGSKVKQKRKIHLTINAVNPKKVFMPNVVGYSLRQAKAEILSKGLEIGRLIYISDIATNNVLKQLYGSREILMGEELECDEKIDLILGLNPNDNRTYIPQLNGLKMISAIDLLHDCSLNVGKVNFDNTVHSYADSISAFVYRQTPESRETNILMGSEVSIFLTLDPDKMPKPEPTVEEVPTLE